MTSTTEPNKWNKNVQYARKKYQESKIEPIMAVDEVLHCGLVNIQSAGNKTINIRNLINEAKFDIFILTETWLWVDVSDSSKIKEMTPKTHTFYHLHRVEKTGGGVGVYISISFSKVTVRNQVIFNTFEYVDLEILSKNNVIKLITLYRPPTIDGKRKEKEFIEEFGNYLDTIDNLRTAFICGDFNLWLDKVSECNYVGEFVELLEAHSLVNSVINPTTKSERIIDLVIHHKDHKLIKNLFRKTAQYFLDTLHI